MRKATEGVAPAAITTRHVVRQLAALM